jgi:hypothetical protein
MDRKLILSYTREFNFLHKDYCFVLKYKYMRQINMKNDTDTYYKYGTKRVMIKNN